MTYKRIDGLPEAEYHAIKALGSTAIKNMAVSPAHYKQERLADDGESLALSIGSMFHQLILEPGRNDFIAAPEVDRRTKEGKEVYAKFLDECEGKTVLKKADFVNTNAMADAFRQTDAYLNMMNGDVATEVSIVGEDKKARFDLLKKHPKGFYIAYDLKTTSKQFPKTERDWQYWFIKSGYHLQAAWYIHVASKAGIQIAGFNFILVSTKAPYEHALVKLDNEWLSPATEKCLAAYELYKKCEKANLWPGSYEMREEKTPIIIPMPTWEF